MAGDDFLSGHGKSRLGFLPGDSACVGLTATPHLLWDSRLHDGATLPKDGAAHGGNVYGVGDDLTNEGSGPSPEFDLGCLVYEHLYGGAWQAEAYKTLDWPNSLGTSGSPPFPADWDDFGGNPCDGGGMTFMVAIGETMRLYEEDGTLSNLDPDGYLDVEMYSNNTTDINAPKVAFTAVGSFDRYLGDKNDVTISGFMEIDLLAMYGLSVWDEEDPWGNHFQVENMLFTMHIDPVERRVYAWRNTDLILRLTWDDDYHLSASGDVNGSCRDDFIDPAGVVNRFLAALAPFGPHTSFGGLGVAYNPLKGAAIFRGCPPSSEDMTTWHSYWFPGGDQPPRTRQYAVRRPYPGGDGTAPHSYELTVPSGGYTEAGFSIRPTGSGPLCGLQFDVTTGDVIRVEVGGEGGYYQVLSGSPVPGAGGWPDGGDGGPSALAGFTGAGGGGSTRIYLNGTLMAIIAGGGGTARRKRKSNGALSSIDSTAAGTAGDPYLTVDGNDAPHANGGKGATGAAPGAAGPGGNPGSGSDGGDGPTNSYSDATYWYSGPGGAGGGYFGGGSGGGAGTALPAGAGAGSHWFHANVRDITTGAAGPTHTAQGVDGQGNYVDVYLG